MAEGSAWPCVWHSAPMPGTPLGRLGLAPTMQGGTRGGDLEGRGRRTRMDAVMPSVPAQGRQEAVQQQGWAEAAHCKSGPRALQCRDLQSGSSCGAFLSKHIRFHRAVAQPCTHHYLMLTPTASSRPRQAKALGTPAFLQVMELSP